MRERVKKIERCVCIRYKDDSHGNNRIYFYVDRIFPGFNFFIFFFTINSLLKQKARSYRVARIMTRVHGIIMMLSECLKTIRTEYRP